MWDECCWPPPHIARTSLQFCCEPKDTSSRQFGVILLGRGFDISVLEIFWPLCFGFSVFVVSVTWMQRARQCSPIDACMRSQSSAKASTARNGMKLSQLIQQHQVPVDVTHTHSHTRTRTPCAGLGESAVHLSKEGHWTGGRRVARHACPVAIFGGCRLAGPCRQRLMHPAKFPPWTLPHPVLLQVWLGSVAERRAYDLCAYPGLSSGGRLFHRAS